MYREEPSGASFVLGIMTGAVIGAGVALLFAPRTGQEMRQQIGEQYRDLTERAGQTAQSMREGAQNIRDSAEQLRDQGRERVQRAASQLSDRLSSTAESAAKSAANYTADVASRFQSNSPSV
jgi:gas vesicle protein